jgi:tripartite-type tricarboxylate transporter receptor subunit TctC
MQTRSAARVSAPTLETHFRASPGHPESFMNRRTLLRFLAGSSVATLPLARAQDTFPDRPIRIMVASSPGALVDQASRLYAERMSHFLKQPVVVENVAGASSLVAARQLFKSPADGYTLMTSANTIVTVPLLNRNAGYAVKDFTAVGELARSPSVLVVGGSSPFKSLPELVAAARRNPRRLSYASGGVGTTGHLPVEIFARQAGIELTHAPYKGISAAIPDIVANRVSFAMGTPTSTVELMKSGALRPLAISSEARSPRFPSVPTFKELGYPEATFEIWIGMVGPTGIPAPVRARLAQALEAARSDRDIVARLEAAGQDISRVRTPEQFEALLRAEEDKFRRVIKDANISVD